MTDTVPPPRIDAHHHVWDLDVRDQPWTAGLPALRRSFDFAELEPALRRHGVDGTVLVQTVGLPAESAELLAAAAIRPRIAGVVGWVDLTAPDVGGRIAELRESPGGDRLVGIRHQVQDEPDPAWLGRVAVRRGLAAVADAGLAFDLLVRPHQLPAAADTVAALPGLRFVLDHAGKPDIAGRGLDPWRTDIAVLAGLPNVAVKLSGLVTEADTAHWRVEDLAPYAAVLFGGFGPDRIMYGSDWPVCLLAGSYDDVIAAAEHLTAGLSPAERTAVFGGTATAWYRL